MHVLHISLISEVMHYFVLQRLQQDLQEKPGSHPFDEV